MTRYTAQHYLGYWRLLAAGVTLYCENVFNSKFLINRRAKTTMLNPSYNKQVWLPMQEGNGCVLFTVYSKSKVGLNEQLFFSD